MNRLSFTTPALQDFQDIHDYIAKDNSEAALQFILRLRDRCKRRQPTAAVVVGFAPNPRYLTLVVPSNF